MTCLTINHYLFESNSFVYLKILIFNVVIAAAVQLPEMLMEKSFPFLYKMLGVVQSGR